MSLGAEYGDLYEDYITQCEEDGETPDEFDEWVATFGYRAEELAEDRGTKRE